MNKNDYKRGWKKLVKKTINEQYEEIESEEVPIDVNFTPGEWDIKDELERMESYLQDQRQHKSETFGDF